MIILVSVKHLGRNFVWNAILSKKPLWGKRFGAGNQKATGASFNEKLTPPPSPPLNGLGGSEILHEKGFN